MFTSSHRPATRVLAAATSLLLFAPLTSQPAHATCGGGGGGGLGGATPGGSAPEQVYFVPWKIYGGGATLPTEGLALYWFPTSEAEARTSGLTNSRRLTLWSGQCVTPILVPDSVVAVRQQFNVTAQTAAVVLARPDGARLAGVSASDGKLDVGAVEKAIATALKADEKLLDQALDEAKAKEKTGDVAAAAALYRQVAQQKCLFPSLGKKATKALDKLGQPLTEAAGTPAAEPTAPGTASSASGAPTAQLDEGPYPNLSDAVEVAQLADLRAGLVAEQALDLATAEARYGAAAARDPGDPVALRFLAELHRHHTGDWALARRQFEQLLRLPAADPVSRAVAQHGLGKMTIHAGDFAGGVQLFEDSVASFPLPLAYRNLAVFWSSEGEVEKAYGYVEKALALDPKDAYTQIFAATYYVLLGRPAAAEAIARQHEGMLEASYNLAVIWAQLGDRERMLELLARHFYTYEQTDAVRAKEMQEARDDRMFAAFHQDAAFVDLTKLADSDPSSYHRDGGSGGTRPMAGATRR